MTKQETKKILVTVPAEIHEQLKRATEERAETISEVIRRAIADYLGKEQEPPRRLARAIGGAMIAPEYLGPVGEDRGDVRPVIEPEPLPPIPTIDTDASGETFARLDAIADKLEQIELTTQAIIERLDDRASGDNRALLEAIRADVRTALTRQITSEKSRQEPKEKPKEKPEQALKKKDEKGRREKLYFSVVNTAYKRI